MAATQNLFIGYFCFCFLVPTFFFIFSFAFGPQFLNDFYYGYVLPKLAFCKTKQIKTLQNKSQCLKCKRVRLWSWRWLAEKEPTSCQMIGNCKSDAHGPFFSLPFRSRGLVFSPTLSVPDQHCRKVSCVIYHEICSCLFIGRQFYSLLCPLSSSKSAKNIG